LWDQIVTMSYLKLDVYSPYPIPSKDILHQKPERLKYPQNFPKYRFYGNNIKYMIDVANKWEDGDLKNALIMVIANHMKKSYLSWNKDTVKDEVIFEHLYELSGGTMNLLKTDEELSNSTDLMRVNKKQSNKMQFSSNKPKKHSNQNQSQNPNLKNKKPSNNNNNNNRK
ncbi:MAG: DUF4290 domain-containing protein, partial [Flavobacterium sp.]|nr:DUF4290 domain-containing protein [Flavobacterium sp.]